MSESLQSSAAAGAGWCQRRRRNNEWSVVDSRSSGTTGGSMSDFLHAHRVVGRTTSSALAAQNVLHAHAVEGGAEWVEAAGGPDHPHRHQLSERSSYTGPSVPCTKEEWAEIMAEHERWVAGAWREWDQE